MPYLARADIEAEETEALKEFAKIIAEIKVGV